MKYLVVGAGGIGGAIGGYLASGGLDAAFVARGAQLETLKTKGLTVRSKIKGEFTVAPVAAFGPDENLPKADVIFVCVKGYALIEAAKSVKKAAHADSLIIPILNSLSAGETLAKELPGHFVLDGCIYTSSFVAEPGVIEQPSPLFRIICGEAPARPLSSAAKERLEQMAAEVRSCEIKVVVSENIARDVFRKFAFISAFATTDCLFDASVGTIAAHGEQRDFFEGLLRELVAIGEALGIEQEVDLFADGIRLLESFTSEVTSSMHKDMAAGRQMETQELVFDVAELANRLNVPAPFYTKAANKFKEM